MTELEEFLNAQLKMSLIPPRLVDINSGNGSGTTSNFTIQLPVLDSRYDRVSIVSASIPKTYYNISAPYNTFILVEGAISVVCTVTPGNYSFYGLNGFDSALQTILRAASPNAISYTVTASLLTGKYTITSNSAIVSQIVFPSSSNLYKNLGAAYASTNIFSSASSYQSLNVCLFTINVILINSSIVKSVNTTTTASNILAMINVNAGPTFSSISYVNYSPEINSRECQISTNASFVITDNEGTEINLNGISCDLTLLFYKFDDTNQVIRRNIYFDHANALLNQ